MSIAELAEYIHYSKSTIYKGTMSHRIPHIKVGKKLLFERDVIDQWLENHNQPTLEEIGVGINSFLKSKNNGQ
jgi:excisionase family DNA binding protein